MVQNNNTQTFSNYEPSFVKEIPLMIRGARALQVHILRIWLAPMRRCDWGSLLLGLPGLTGITFRRNWTRRT